MPPDLDACQRLIEDLSTPMERLKLLLSLVPTLDDIAMPRADLINWLYTIGDYFEEVHELVELYDRELER